jgi:acyl-coenzyme A thioesterase PaaI-like protein
MSPPLSATIDTGELVRRLEQAMVEAARARHPGRLFEAIDLHLSLMGGAHGPLTAHAEVVGGGKTMSFCEARLDDAQGRAVAQALGTLRAV